MRPKSIHEIYDANSIGQMAHRGNVMEYTAKKSWGMSSLKTYLKDTSGNVAMIAGLAIIPIISVLGLAIDFQFVVTKKNTVQQLLDQTLIAAARDLQAGGDRGAVESRAGLLFETLLAANDPNIDCEPINASFAEDSEDLFAFVDCRQPTTLSAIFGRDHFDFRVDSGSTFGVGEVDVAFVFDLSGSMNQNNRLTSLRSSAEIAFETLLAANETGEQNVRIAIASYNHSVNAGNFFDRVVEFNNRPSRLESSENAGDLFPENYGVVQIDGRDGRRFFDYETVRCDSGDDTDCQDYTDWAGRFYPEPSNCVYARLGGDALSDRAPAQNRFLMSDQPLWDYLTNRNESRRPDEFNAKRRGQWEIENRALGQFRDGGDGRNNPPLQNTGATGNSAPSSYGRNRFGQGGNNITAENNALTYHIRLRDEVPGQPTRDAISTNRRMNECRTSAPPLPLTDRISTLRNYLTTMSADGATAGHLGIAWGWYLLSPKWDDIWPNASEPLEYFEEETAKAMIIMTDGVFNSTHPLTPKNSNETAADYCRAIKNNTNIQIYTIGFDVPTRTETVDGVEITVPNLPDVEGTNQNILEFCASSAEATFDATNSEELEEAYEQIAAEISDLRISN